MTPRGRVVLVVVLVVLGIGEFSWAWFRAMTQITETAEAQFLKIAQPHVATMPPLPPGHQRNFSKDELHAFVAQARSAEAIADPLQRCLKYPDPPGSHWSAATVQAYCQFRLQPVISFAEAQQLIRSGHAADLDRRLAQALQAQLTQPQSRGLLDRIYSNAFYDNSFDARQTIDAWKRASPNSAFALAASGTAYVAMAHKARGSARINETPQSNLDAMDRLLQQADTDLQRAAQLNPKIAPIYVTMMDAGSMSLGSDYANRAFSRAIAAVPDDYVVYDEYMRVNQPKWGGSLQTMTNIGRAGQLRARNNPLLTLLLAESPGYAYNACDCALDADTQWDAFPTVFDNVGNAQLLLDAGYAANLADHPELAVVYLSEGLRFRPDENFAHIRRAFALTAAGEPQWALDEANREIAREPQSAWGYSMRGYAYKALRDPVHAAPDLEKATTLAPDNSFPLQQLGWMYAFDMHQWDKGWDVADRLIHDHPDEAAGWVLRFNIQQRQPRQGIDGTMREFLSRFGNDPDQAELAARMRVALAAEAGDKGHGVGKGARSP